MQISGAVGAAAAMQTMVVAPQTAAPVESARAAQGPVDDATQRAVLAMATAQAMPDASTVATMQNLAGLPASSAV